MKVINSIQGMTALQWSPDDAVPETRVLMRDLVEFIATTFSFAGKPEVPVGPVDMTLIFQAGAAILEDKKVPINQLILAPTGYAVTAKDTDTAELLCLEIIKAIEGKFGHKLSGNVRAKYYSSNLVIEFDPGIDEQIAWFGRIKRLLEREIERGDFPFDFKRLVFGAEEKAVATAAAVNVIDGIKALDFVIERRVGEPADSNRYFSSAPATTSKHEKILRLIERAAKE